MINEPLTRFIFSEDQDIFYLHCTNVFETENQQTCEIRMVKEDGDFFYAHLESLATQDTEGNFSQLLTTITDITDLKQAEEQIAASLREKEVLLREIHHRVKNNMQVITSLLSLQAGTVEDERVLEALEASRNRIKTMSLVHETLYGSDSLAVIDLKKYLSRLANIAFMSCKTSQGMVKLKVEIDNIKIGINHAHHIGLIANELISNALKHAFPDARDGELAIMARAPNQEEIELVVSDNGTGIPEDIDWRNTDSLGLRIVVLMAEHQLLGTVNLERDNGTRFTVRFKLDESCGETGFFSR